MDRRAEENDWRETVFTEDLYFLLAMAGPDFDPRSQLFVNVGRVHLKSVFQSGHVNKSIVDVTQSQMLFQMGPVFSEWH